MFMYEMVRMKPAEMGHKGALKVFQNVLAWGLSEKTICCSLRAHQAVVDATKSPHTQTA